MDKISFWLRNIFIVLLQYLGIEFGSKLVWYVSDDFSLKTFYGWLMILPWVLVLVYELNKKFNIVKKLINTIKTKQINNKPQE